MNRCPIKPLGDLCDVEGGNAAPQGQEHFQGGTIPFVRMKDLGRHHLTNNLTETDDKLTEAGAAASSMKLFEPGCILFPRSGSVALNHRAILGVRAHIVSHIGVLRNFRPEITPGFLYLYLTTFDMTALSKKTTGVDSIAFSDVRRIPVPVPPLVEQERIVKLLDEADELRKLRAQADRRTADLIPALFHEMFGDPATNPKRWPKRPLRDLGKKFSDGPFGSNLKSSHYAPEGVRVVRLQNVGVGRFLNGDKTYISEKHFEQMQKHECIPGDVIVGTLGDPNLRACILPQEIPQALNKADCVQIRPNAEIATGEFICWLLNLASVLSIASGRIYGQTRSRISMGRLAQLTLPVPPLTLREDFAVRAKAVRELESKQAASRERLDALFHSMLHRAFNGDL